MGARVLLAGSGGREHAAAWKLSQSPHVGEIFISPGNGGTALIGANLAKLEIRVLYEELLPRFGTIEAAGPVEWTRSNRHTGIRHLPLVLSR